MLKSSLNILFLSYLLCIPSLHADSELDNLLAMSIEELLQVEIQGSTRTQQSLLTVPSSVTVFTHEEINNLGATTLNQLMNYVAGFQSRRAGTSSNIYASTTRGHKSGDPGRSILIILDGQRLDSDYNGGSGITYSLIPLENVKKIEFIRGAGSSLYGSGAFSAVINITSLKDVNSVSARFNADSYQASALVSIKEEDTLFSGFVKGVKDKGQEYTELKDTLGNGQTTARDPYNSVDVYLQAKYKDLSLYFSYNERDMQGFYSLQRLSKDNYKKNKNTYLRANYELDISPEYISQVSLSYIHAQDEFLIELAPQGQTPFLNDALYGKAAIDEDIYSFEWFNSYTISTNQSLQFGAEYRYLNITKAQVQYNYDIINTPPQNPFYNPNYYDFDLSKKSSRNVYGLYAQYQASLIEDLHLTLGFRYDKYSDFGESYNPRAALVYQAFEETSFKLLYAKAFRAPAKNELDLQNNGVLVGNPNLKPAIINSYEAIFLQQYQGHSISLSYYLNKIDDIILAVTQADGSLTRDNIGSGDFRGMEIEYIAEPMKNFQVRASYSHVFAKPDFVITSSNDIASTILNYNTKSYNLNLSAFYNSSSQNNDNGVLKTLPSYTLVNTKLSYMLTKDSKIFLQVNNLLHTEYFTPAEGSSFSIAIPNRGVEGFLGFNILF
ncbi:TonB-dependent receptor [Sulfurimonas sp. MAG313]|nr:TonB-dependent receptor [Sulfurimonas sp. MAG313]MDF1880865.1 TonB-dependent receptor [Sulfurimonas sp. MAG313]